MIGRTILILNRWFDIKLNSYIYCIYIYVFIIRSKLTNIYLNITSIKSVIIICYILWILYIHYPINVLYELLSVLLQKAFKGLFKMGLFEDADELLK